MTKKYRTTKGGIITNQEIKTDESIYGLCLTCKHSFRNKSEETAGKAHISALCFAAPGFMPPIPTDECSHHEEKEKS